VLLKICWTTMDYHCYQHQWYWPRDNSLIT